MITGRKVLSRKIRTTPPETLVARLNQPHLIPHKDNIFQEIDHNTIGYLDGLAATSNEAFGRDRQTSLSGTAMDINTMTSTYRDGIGFVPDKLPAEVAGDDGECACVETDCGGFDVPAPEPNVTVVEPFAYAIDIWAKPIGDAISFYENFVKSVNKMNSSMKELQEAFDVDLPLDTSPSDEQLRAMIDRAPLFTHTEGAGPYDGDPEDLTFVKQVSHDYGATWQDSINTSIRTDDLWRLIFEKYRLLDASMLLRRRDEIDVLFNMMVNQRQVNKIDDELFNEIVDRIKRFTEKRDAIPPKNRPTAGSGSAYQ